MPKIIRQTALKLKSSVKALDGEKKKELIKLLCDIEVFKRNRERSKIFLENLDNGLRKSLINKELVGRADVFKLKKQNDSTDNPNYKDRYGFNLVFFKYKEEL